MEKITQRQIKNKKTLSQAQTHAWTFPSMVHCPQKEKSMPEFRHERMGVRIWFT
jgi:hypothetical protein